MSEHLVDALFPAATGPRVAGVPDLIETTRTRDGVRGEFLGAGAAALLVLAAFAVPQMASESWRESLFAGAAPLFAWWSPHIGWGTVPAVVLAAAVVTQGPALAQRLSWRPLLGAGYLTALGWALALALVDGWERGVTARLADGHEYLTEVPGVTDIPLMLDTFADRILDGQPDSWTTHVSGHPPGALLFFVLLDRLGLGGPTWAGVVCVLIGCSAPIAVAVALRALGSEDRARAALPFLVLAPAAIWIAVSADAMFAGVTAWAVASLAVAASTGTRYTATRRETDVTLSARPGTDPGAPGVRGGTTASASEPGVDEHEEADVTTAVSRPAGRREAVATATAAPGRWAGAPAAGASGILFGFGIYLNYGLVLMGFMAVAVLVAARTVRPLLPAVLGALIVVAAFTAAGFWWFDGYHLVVERYYQGIATDRPYGYWWWGNLAATVCAVGLATAAALSRALAPARLRVFEPGSLLVAAGLCAIVAADISGLSKAETERIWLPFDLWLLAATAYLPQVRARPWLAVQAAAALVLVHLLMTNW
ncbi:hypothetical protein [Nocardia sp. NPDC051750]|uniref:hypothetical protein n=1 Tax=Nocardia sp. NPDC051750 TaxID=3364325 RepID=UPI0037B6BEB2